MSQPPLAGLKVVDFTRVLAGPHCTKVLHDLGADVVKVEPPGRGDLTRYAVPGTPGRSRYFHQQNAGKRCISLDLNFPEARALAMEVCRDADVIVENFRPGTLAHFGLGYEDVRAENPRVIYVSVSGYGQRTSMSYRGAFAPTIHAEMGHLDTLLHHFGDALSAPAGDVYSHADVYSGLEAVIATLAALHHRTRTGRGQHVDVSMAATMMAVSERAHADMSGDYDGAEPLALGATESPMLRLRDGRSIVIAASPVFTPIFIRYCAMLRRSDLRRDPRFSSAEARRANLDAFLAIVQTWVYTFRSFEELETHVTEAGLAVGVVRSMAEWARSEWALEWGATVEVEADEADESDAFRLPGPPWRFSESSVRRPTEARGVGADNWRVLSACGLDETAFRELADRGVLFSQESAR